MAAFDRKHVVVCDNGTGVRAAPPQSAAPLWSMPRSRSDEMRANRQQRTCMRCGSKKHAARRKTEEDEKE